MHGLETPDTLNFSHIVPLLASKSNLVQFANMRRIYLRWDQQVRHVISMAIGTMQSIKLNGTSSHQSTDNDHAK